MNAHAQRLIAARLGLALLSLLLVSVVVFAITGLLPGDAAQEALGQDATPEAVAALRAPDRPRRARAAALPPLARAYRERQLRHVAVEQPAGRRADRHPAAEFAAAGRPDRARLGADRARARHLLGDVARLAARSRAQRADAVDRRRARVPGRDARRADLRGASCAGCRRCRICRRCRRSARCCASSRCR